MQLNANAKEDSEYTYPKQLDIAQVSIYGLTLVALMFFSMGGMVTGLGVAKIHAL